MFQDLLESRQRMNSGGSDSPVTATITSALDRARQEAREQLAAAWQAHVERVEGELRSRWGGHLESLLNERFHELSTELTSRLEAEFAERIKAEVEAARADERHSSIRRVSEHLNAAARRLRTVERQDEWASTLTDAALGFCDRVGVFSIQGKNLRLEKCSQPVGSWEAPLEEAPAIAQAVESLEPMVSAYSPGQISPSLAAVLGQVAPKLYAFPIVTRGKAVGVLTAEGESATLDPNALELLASIASSVYEIRSAENERKETEGLVKIEEAPRQPVQPTWTSLPADDQDLHLRAQRFARVQVAEMRLYKSQAVKEGRAEKRLYRCLKEDIDRGRDQFRQQFLLNSASMTDYFHVELVRTLANDDSELLGPDYPGPLA